MNRVFCTLLLLVVFACKPKEEKITPGASDQKTTVIKFAKGFSIQKEASGLSVIEVASPWPNSESTFKYALVPKDKKSEYYLNKNDYDAVVAVPVERLVVTSTTHIPALEALGVTNRLVGFPSTQFISSKATRERIEKGLVQELGANESINTEILIELNPDVVVGFGINGKNKAYETLQYANIPLVYNGDWVEETPLGKAEWIKFFAPFFGLEAKADSLFTRVDNSYRAAKQLAEKAKNKPTVLSGGLYKDVWYVAGGKSWMAQFFKDANVDYLWKDSQSTGSISLSIESVLEKAEGADFWLNPSMHTSYDELEVANRHYLQFEAFENRQVFTHARTTGQTGGLLFYEFAPNRPDIVLQDLIHIFHPELLPDHQPYFFKPLK